MPGFDGNGPKGQGPMSGRGMGYCTGYHDGPRQGGFGFGRGFRGGRGGGFGFRGGRGRGRGYGWGADPYYDAPQAPYYNEAPLTQDQEVKMLKAQLKQYRRVTDELQSRLGELEKDAKED